MGRGCREKIFALKIYPGRFQIHVRVEIQVILISNNSHLNGYDDTDFHRQGSGATGQHLKILFQERDVKIIYKDKLQIKPGNIQKW